MFGARAVCGVCAPYMACASECLGHTLGRSGQHIRVGTHRATNQHRLTGQLIIDRYQWMVWREGACRTFTMDEETLALAIHHVLLDLRNVVRDIVNLQKAHTDQHRKGKIMSITAFLFRFIMRTRAHMHLLACCCLSAVVLSTDYMHIQIIGRRFKHLCECLSYEKGHTTTIHPGIVGSSSHSGEVVLTLLTVDASTGKLLNTHTRTRERRYELIVVDSVGIPSRYRSLLPCTRLYVVVLCVLCLCGVPYRL